MVHWMWWRRERDQGDPFLVFPLSDAPAERPAAVPPPEPPADWWAGTPSPPLRAPDRALEEPDSPSLAHVPGGGGLLQFLPGSLEVLQGPGEGAEIRFIRDPRQPPEFTVGRATGPVYRHVQLSGPSVSRLHACLRWDGAEWRIENLSHTNPVRINGEPLTGGTRVLSDGDEIHLGEVGLRFRFPASGRKPS